MFYRIVVLVCLMSVFSTQAAMPYSKFQTQLDQAYDKLSFNLEVLWDGEDLDFHNQSLKSFQKTLHDLKQKGMSTHQFLNFLKEKIKNDRVSSDLDELINTVKTQKMSAEEAQNFLMNYLEKAYSTGSSWAPDMLLVYGVNIVVIVGVILLFALSSPSGEGEVDPSVPGNCYQDYICDYFYDTWDGAYTHGCFWHTFCR